MHTDILHCKTAKGALATEFPLEYEGFYGLTGDTHSVQGTLCKLLTHSYRAKVEL